MQKETPNPGQVSFPGGAVDRTDRSAISTALREAEEEIGLDFSQVSPLVLAVSFNEYTHEEIGHDGKTFTMSSLQWQGHRIWGVTAAILLNLGGRMNKPG